MNIILLFRAAFYICLVVIEYLATTTRHIPIVESMWDKANHFIAFFTLFILLTLAYSSLNTLAKFLLLLAFGMQIEIVQSFIDGREFSLLDVVADSIGIIIGIFAWSIFTKLRAKAL